MPIPIKPGAALLGSPSTAAAPTGPTQPATLPLAEQATPNPSAEVPTAVAAPTPMKPPTAQQTQAAHDTLWGHAVRVLKGAINNTSTQYKVNPETGRMEATEVKERPGQIFRNILLGALVGGAAGQAEHDHNPYTGVGAGLMAGGAATIQDQRNQDLLKRQQASNDFERQQQIKREQATEDLEQQRLQRENTLDKATIAHYAIQDTRSAYLLNHAGERDIEQQNGQAQLLLQNVIKQHGTLAKGIPNNDALGNGRQLEAYFTQNPSALVSPNGGMRVPVKIVDTTGLHYDALHGGWKDEKGDIVDLSDHTRWAVYDIPPTADLNQTVPVSGAQLKKLFPEVAGDIPADKKYQMPMRTLFSLVGQSRARANEATQREFDRHQAVLNGQFKSLTDQLNATRSELASLPDKEGNEAKRLRQDIEIYRSQLADLESGLNPYTKAMSLPFQQRAWEQVKVGEVPMTDGKGNVQAVPVKKEEDAKQAGWKLIPYPEVR